MKEYFRNYHKKYDKPEQQIKQTHADHDGSLLFGTDCTHFVLWYWWTYLRIIRQLGYRRRVIIDGSSSYFYDERS